MKVRYSLSSATWSAMVAILFLLVFASCRQGNSEFVLAKIFSEHMVLQRNQAIKIYGHAAKGDRVDIFLDNMHLDTRSDGNGHWSVQFPPMGAGGPYQLEVQHKGNSIKFNDIYVGEVWLAGGQSNMQYTFGMLGQVPDVNSEITGVFRFFNVEIDWDVAPREDIKGGTWQQLTSENIRDFSAVAYYFGALLQDSLQIPIGIISSNLGATSIETWMSREALLKFPQFDSIVHNSLHPYKTKKEFYKDLEPAISQIEKEFFSSDSGMIEQWYLPDNHQGEWNTIQVPYLNAWSGKDLNTHQGIVWLYRKTAGWPTSTSGVPFLSLNQVADVDKVWVNGTEIGSSWGGRIWRHYPVPDSVLNIDTNEIVVRVYGHTTMSGLYTSAFWGNDILTGTWNYKLGRAGMIDNWDSLWLPNGSIFTHPAILYNANIAPLHKFSIGGVIWYQGESNEERGKEYAGLLPALMKDWSRAWNRDNLPFYIGQLASYRSPDTLHDGKSQWATIREGQYLASQRPHSGLASAIDVGDADDIHPPEKQPVGERLAFAALRNTFDNLNAPVSPEIHGVVFEGRRAYLSFSGDTLEAVSNKYYDGFILAGEDQQFHQAKGMYNGNQMVVESSKVAKPIAVRYAWADNPDIDYIMSVRGLPLLPYRSDKWPLINDNKTFEYDPIGF